MEDIDDENRYASFTTCICLHNLYIMQKDKFDGKWAIEGGRMMWRECLKQVWQLENVKFFMATTQATKNMRRYLRMDDVEVDITKIKDIEHIMANEDIKDMIHDK